MLGLLHGVVIGRTEEGGGGGGGGEGVLLSILVLICFLILTPSLPWCHLKTTNKSAKPETLKHFSFPFHTDK